MSAQSPAQEFAEDIADHPVVSFGARAGYGASGLVHALIGWLGVRVAWQHYDGTADQNGALAMFNGNVAGFILLIIIACGFTFLGVWNLASAFGVSSWLERLKPIGKGIAYLVIAAMAIRFALIHRPARENSTRNLTEGLLSNPIGMIIVAIIGLVIIGMGIYHGYKGATRRFLRDLDDNPGKIAMIAGRIGYLAKGLAFIAIGIGFIKAAWEHSPENAGGLDGALRTFLTLPFGPYIVTSVSAGFALYAIYSVFRARYAKH